MSRVWGASYLGACRGRCNWHAFLRVHDGVPGHAIGPRGDTHECCRAAIVAASVYVILMRFIHPFTRALAYCVAFAPMRGLGISLSGPWCSSASGRLAHPLLSRRPKENPTPGAHVDSAQSESHRTANTALAGLLVRHRTIAGKTGMRDQVLDDLFHLGPFFTVS